MESFRSNVKSKVFYCNVEAEAPGPPFGVLEGWDFSLSYLL